MYNKEITNQAETKEIAVETRTSGQPKNALILQILWDWAKQNEKEAG